MMEAVGSAQTLTDVSIELPGRQSGKVREAWPLSGGRRLLVTTDRLSAFDRVLGAVTHKGQVLNQLSAWWFGETSDIVANHVLSVPDPMALIAVDAKPLPIEVIVRSRLTGSTSTALLPRYLNGERELYGHLLPDGLKPHGPLGTILITPTTKALKGGHDEPISSDEIVARGLVDEILWAKVQAVALALFERGARIAADAGFLLADTKYEFGLDAEGELMLIDELHTPDSSRFWLVETLQRRLDEGLTPEGFDKEPVRLAFSAAGYTGDGTPPTLDPGVWQETSDRYVRLYEALTGLHFSPASLPAIERLTTNLAPYLGGEPTATTAV